MKRILVIKTGALGDVLRTTSILPGLVAKHAPCRVTWLAGPDAAHLVAHHRHVDEVVTVEPDDADAVAAIGERLRTTGFELAISLDDDEALCRLATHVSAGAVCGAHLSEAGAVTYTEDAEPWFGMGLLARAGRAEADRRKLENLDTHGAILARILGVEPGRPELPLEQARLDSARERLDASRARRGVPLIGLNTGAGGRWVTKALPVERVIELVRALHERFAGAVSFVLFGGEEERTRNVAIREAVAALPGPVDLVDTGTDNHLLDFAALVSLCDLLITSDSLGMHVAIAREVPVVAFFAPTSAAEIDLFGRGEKVVSTAPDYCSYRTDADNSTITAERLADAAMRVLAGR